MRISAPSCSRVAAVQVPLSCCPECVIFELGADEVLPIVSDRSAASIRFRGHLGFQSRGGTPEPLHSPKRAIP